MKTWMGPYDQSYYLRMAREMALGTFDKTDFEFGLGYPLLGVPFAFFQIENPFAVVNILMFFGIIFFSYLGLIALFPVGITIGGLVCVLMYLPFHEFIIGVPWNNSVTILSFTILFYINFSYKVLDVYKSFVIGFIIGWVFASRYLDAIFLMIVVLPIIFRTCRTYFTNKKRLLMISSSGIIIGFAMISAVLYSHNYYLGGYFCSPYKKHVLHRGHQVLFDQDLKTHEFSKSLPHIYGVFINSDGCYQTPSGTKSLFEKFPLLYFCSIGFVLLYYQQTQKRIDLLCLLVGLFLTTYFYAAYYLQPGNLRFNAFRYIAFYYPLLTTLSIYGVMAIFRYESPYSVKSIIIGSILMVSTIVLLQIITKHSSYFEVDRAIEIVEKKEFKIDSDDYYLASNRNTKDLKKLDDGDRKSRWTTNTVQRKNDYLNIKFKALTKIRLLKFDNSGSPNDHPGQFKVFIKTQKDDWYGIEVVLKFIGDNLYILIPDDLPPLSELKISLLKDGNKWFWSIHEMILFRNFDKFHRQP